MDVQGGGVNNLCRHPTEVYAVAYPVFLKSTGHCNEGHMFIDERWASQIGNSLIRRFFAYRVAHQGFWESCWLRSDLRLRQVRSCLRIPQTGWAPQSQRCRACPEYPYAEYATGYMYPIADYS